MTADEIEKWYIENHGDLKKAELITDVIAKGKTLVYGSSGVGKTYSIIKHLNRFNKVPLLIDFDNNFKFEELNFRFTGGAEFLSKFHEKPKKDFSNIEKLEEDRLKLIRNQFAIYRETLTVDTDKISEISIANMQRMYDDFDDKLCNIDSEIMATNPLIKENTFKPKNEILIIDTCAKALRRFKDIDSFDLFVNKLLGLGNDVILIAHTKRYLNDEVPDMDEEFVNHCDCRLHLVLNKSITKGTSTVYLDIRKLRGYKGETIIKNWER